MLKSFHVRIANDGRVMIPATLRKRLGLHPGDTVVIEEEDNSARLSGYAQVLREVQTAFAPYRVSGLNVVDELIAERRAEAAKEDAELDEWLDGRGLSGNA